jgi:hypothetical protein
MVCLRASVELRIYIGEGMNLQTKKTVAVGRFKAPGLS